jgi:hypothetical protein
VPKTHGRSIELDRKTGFYPGRVDGRYRIHHFLLYIIYLNFITAIAATIQGIFNGNRVKIMEWWKIRQQALRQAQDRPCRRRLSSPVYKIRSSELENWDY